MKLTITGIAHHRNGICGAPFNVVLFKDKGPEGSRKVAILFDERDHCAVLDVDKLTASDIAFGSNSWRGDNYEPQLREAVKAAVTASEDDDATAGREPVHLDHDVRQLLAEQRQIAAIWSIEDVQAERPDLTEQQAWEVLQKVERRHDAEVGISWMTLRYYAEDLFGDAPEDTPS